MSARPIENQIIPVCFHSCAINAHNYHFFVATREIRSSFFPSTAAQLCRANLCLHETSPGGVCLGIQEDQHKPLITLRKHISIQEEFVLNFSPSEESPPFQRCLCSEMQRDIR